MAGPKKLWFDRSIFWRWIRWAIIHGSVALILPIFVCSSEQIDSTGVVMGFWHSSLLSFSIIIIIVNLKLVIITLLWVKWNLAVLIGSFLFYLLCLLNMNLFWMSELEPCIWNLVPSVAGTPIAWILLVFTPLLCLLPDVIHEYFFFFLFFFFYH